MAPSRRSQFSNVVGGVFDAALLLDKKGKIRHANEMAMDMFRFDASVGQHYVDMLMLFLSNSSGEVTDYGDVSWRDIYPLIMKSEQTSQWAVSCVRQDDESKFSANAKLTNLSSSDGSHYILLVLRADSEALRKKREEPKVFSESEDPMLAIDEMGTILMFNQVATETFEWCEPTAVGENLSDIIKTSSFQWRDDPIMSINDRGNILSVNASSVMHIPWCSQSLVGCNIMSLEDSPIILEEEEEDDDDNIDNTSKIGGNSVKYQDEHSTTPSLISWFSAATKRSTEPPTDAPSANTARKGSPRVLRVFITSMDDPLGDSMAGALAEDSSPSLSPSFAISRGGQTSEHHSRDESMLTAVVEAALDPLIQINERGTIEMVNNAAVRQFGYSREEMLGSNIKMIVGGGHAANHDKYIERYLKTGKTSVIGHKRELMGRKSDGTEFPIELAVVEVDTFQGEDRLFCGFIRDLTSIKRKERITNDIVEASLDPMFLINESGTIRMVNKASVNMFGFTRAELLSSNISVIVGGNHAKNHDHYLRKHMTQHGGTGVIGKISERLARRKDGSEFPVQLGVIEMNTSADEERIFCGFIHDITEVKAQERVSRGIIESSLDAMFRITDHGIIEMVNESAVTTFGFSREEFVGGNISMIVGKHHAPNHDSYLKNFRKTGVRHIIGERRELMARKKDGSEFPVELYVTIISDEITKQRGFCGFVRDLTETKKNQDLMEGLIRASTDPIFATDSKGKILMVNEAATELYQWSRDEFMGKNISMICGGSHAKAHHSYMKNFLRTGDAKVIGKARILPARRKDGTEVYVELTVKEVKTISGTRFFCGHTRDMTQTLRKEEIMGGVIEGAFDPMFLIDKIGTIEMVNNAAVRTFGWKREEFVGGNIKMVVGHKHQANHDMYLKRYLETGIAKVIGKRRELHAQRKDGTEFPMELGLAEIITEHGGERLYCGFVRNLTARKHQEHAVQTRERLVAGIVQASLDPLFQINQNGIIVFVNTAACTLFGYSEDEFIGSNIRMIVGKEHAANHDKYIQRYLKTGVAKVMGKRRELAARRKNGSEITIKLSLSEIETDDGEDRLFCGFIMDLTRMKNDERAIVREKRRVERKERLVTGIINASSDSMFQITSKGTIQTVNNNACRVFGYHKRELIGSNISKVVGKEHAKHHDQYIRRYLETGEARVMGKSRELKARRKDGSEFYVELFLREIDTSSGDERLFCGFIRDITKKKRQEASLARRERLMTGIIDAALDPLFQINQNGIIQTVNKSACQVFQYTEDELVGRNVKIIVGGSHARNHDGYLKRYLKTGETHVMGKKRELPARRKDGSQFMIELSLSEVRTGRGNERIFCGFIRDLSQRNEHQNTILQGQRLLSGVLNASPDPVFQIDERGIIQNVNKAACYLFGYSSTDEFVGNNVSMIVGKAHAHRHDEYLNRYLETGVARVMGKKRELYARRKDGTEFVIELGLSEVQTSAGEDRLFCGFVRDISRLKAQQQELLQRERITKGMVDSCPDPIFQIDSKGIIMVANRAATRHFGWTQDEFLGRNIKMIVGRRHSDAHDSYLDEYMSTGTSAVIGKNRVMPARRKDGSEFNIELTVVEVKTSRETYFCGYTRVLK